MPDQSSSNVKPMRRKYRLNPLPWSIGPQDFIKLAETAYAARHPSDQSTGQRRLEYCIMYLVVNPDKTLRLDFQFQEDLPLLMRVVAKKPKGLRTGDPVDNVDLREITKIVVPPYNGKYFFDFMFCVRDPTTDGYWLTNLWTRKVCPDLRYYLSRERKHRYNKIGLQIAQAFTRTFVLGHVNLKSGRLRSSRGIARLVRHGWIPTISLLPQPYGEMVRIIESTNDLAKVGEFAVTVFDENLLDRVVDRWLEASLVRDRKDVLTSAIESYKSGDYVSTIYVLLPQIEGLITKHIKRRRMPPEVSPKDRFSQFGDIVKSESFNTEFTRYLTDVLVSNLSNAFYKTWYPYPKKGKVYRASSLSPQRHVALHGQVNPKYFTQENCVKLICILDSVILLSLRKTELPARQNESQ